MWRGKTRTLEPMSDAHARKTREDVLLGLAEIRRVRRRLYVVGSIVLALLGIGWLLGLFSTPAKILWFGVVLAGMLVTVIVGVQCQTATCPNCERSFCFEGDDALNSWHSNTFTSKCIHCGLHVDGANVEAYGL